MNQHYISAHCRAAPRRRLNRSRFLRRVIEVAVGLFVLLGAYALVERNDLEVRLKEQKSLTRKYSSILASCMNGGAIYDHASGVAHFCERVLSIQVRN